MRPTSLLYHPSFLGHDTGQGHPERPDRLRAIVRHLEQTDLWSHLARPEPELAPTSVIELVHPAAYIDAIAHACRSGPTALDPDTIASPGSWDAARRAVGAVTQAIDAVVAEHAASAFCAVRPPGHHALARRAMGFCLFNNVAIGARYAQQRHGLRRVLIVDWDVHHGNGTQAIFYDDPSLCYFSTHQAPFYPGTGDRGEVGRGEAMGLTRNVPLPAGSGDAELVRAFEHELLPLAESFKPELVLISSGFDAHRDDPLAHLEVTEVGYAQLTSLVRHVADTYAHGRVVSVLEGGYDLNALAASTEAHLRALAA
jgi:acetoin utilization deacetylase AcuC-like enzyme